MSTTYTIKTYTGTISDAGTDANVYITLHGSAGSSNETELDNNNNNFENGDVDTFSFDMADYGDLNQVRIRHDNSGKKPGWYLDKITVQSSSKTWTFPCNNWLAKDEGDQKIDRTLDAA